MADLSRLAVVAEAATPGPWIQIDRLPYLHATSDPKAKPWCAPVVGRFDYSDNDMAFVATFNPATVKLLLDVARAAKEDLDLHRNSHALRAALAALEAAK